jgi:hypothetical protein
MPYTLFSVVRRLRILRLNFFEILNKKSFYNDSEYYGGDE